MPGWILIEVELLGPITPKTGCRLPDGSTCKFFELPVGAFWTDPNSAEKDQCVNVAESYWPMFIKCPPGGPTDLSYNVWRVDNEEMIGRGKQIIGYRDSAGKRIVVNREGACDQMLIDYEIDLWHGDTCVYRGWLECGILSECRAGNRYPGLMRTGPKEWEEHKVLTEDAKLDYPWPEWRSHSRFYFKD